MNYQNNYILFLSIIFVEIYNTIFEEINILFLYSNDMYIYYWFYLTIKYQYSYPYINTIIKYNNKIY